jgi:hypothetical protein
LVVGFEIRSEQSFHHIKKSVWTLLTKHDIFLKKHSGPLSTMDIVSIGYIHHAHPTFVSVTGLRAELLEKINAKLNQMSASDIDKLALTDVATPDIFLTAGHIHGSYLNGKIQSNVIYIQAEHSRSTELKNIVEACYTDETMTYIPNALKHEDPELFGKFLCHQNDFLENHRNIAIVGVSVEVMDHKELDDMSPADELVGPSIWNTLRTTEGVSRIDPCCRTSDLGKWNISCTKEHYTSVTQWIDLNLVDLFNTTPFEVRTSTEYTEFPVPTRLSHTLRSAPSNKRQNPSAYNRTLATRLGTSNTVSKIQRSAWRPHQPVVDISYAFDESAFPHLNKDTETKSTASTSHISSISEQALKTAIASETEKLKERNKLHKAEINVRISSLETTLSSLTQTIVSEIFAKLSGSDSPFVTVIQLDAKLDCLSQQIAQLAEASVNTSADSPRRKKQLLRLNDQETKDMAIDDEPPGLSE